MPLNSHPETITIAGAGVTDLAVAWKIQQHSPEIRQAIMGVKHVE